MLNFEHELVFLFFFFEFVGLPLFLHGIDFLFELEFSERGASDFVEVEFFDLIVVKVFFGKFLMKEVSFLNVGVGVSMGSVR